MAFFVGREDLFEVVECGRSIYAVPEANCVVVLTGIPVKMAAQKKIAPAIISGIPIAAARTPLSESALSVA